MTTRTRRPTAPTLLLLTALVAATGCSQSPERPLATSFTERGERVWEAYDRQQSAEARVELSTPATSVAISVDCAGDSGDVEVTTGLGGTSLPCPHDGDPQTAVVSSEADPVDVLDIEVQATNDVRWSVAVDVGPDAAG